MAAVPGFTNGTLPLHVCLGGLTMCGLGLLLWISVTAQAGPSDEPCDLQFVTPSAKERVAAASSALVTGRIPKGAYVWLFARRAIFGEGSMFWPKGTAAPEAKSAIWWPQGEAPPKGKGVWTGAFTLGEERDAGEVFDVAAMAVTATVHFELQTYFDRATASGKWDPLDAPASHCSATLTVRRE